jgi:uncharacterized membrane protein
MNPGKLVGLGLALVVGGILLITLGSLQGGSASSGGFILIGPFPIAFGTGSNGEEQALLSVALGGIMVFLFFVYLRWGTLIRKGGSEIDK